MASEYVFEKSWWMFYLWGSVSLGGWLFIMGAASWIYRAALKDNRQRPLAQGRKYKRDIRLLALFIAILGSLLCGALAFVVAAPYLTRFDREGLGYFSVTGWKSEPWSQVSAVELTSISGYERPTLRVFLPLSVLELDSAIYVHPEQVAQALQAEVEKHKRPQAEQNSNAAHPAAHEEDHG